MLGDVIKWTLLACFVSSIVYVQLRGKVKQRWLRQMFDHSALLAPLNVLMYVSSKVPTRQPYLPSSTFPEIVELEKHWETIRDEALELQRQERIRASARNDDAGFNSFFKEGWKRFYLKWYDDPPPSAAQCPRTVALLREVPCIKAALFAYLPAGAVLNPHRDPYAGSLRYHLGLVTPNDDRCRIWVDGEPYSWRDGQGIIFDETFVHTVRNETDQDRLILLCDVERPVTNPIARVINRYFSRNVMSAAASPNDSRDRTGVIGKLFVISHVMGRERRRFKRWSPLAYNATRIALAVVVVGLFIWW